MNYPVTRKAEIFGMNNMINRFKISYGEGGSLKSIWINFLGMFIYYLHDINVHNHIYYNKSYDYCYSVKADGRIHIQEFGIPTGAVRVSDKERYNTTPLMKYDKCIMCNSIRRPDYLFR